VNPTVRFWALSVPVPGARFLAQHHEISAELEKLPLCGGCGRSGCSCEEMNRAYVELDLGRRLVTRTKSIQASKS